MEDYMKKFCIKQRLLPESFEQPEEEVPFHESISFEQKVEFAEKIRRVNYDVLIEIVKIVESQCKAALDDIDAERVQIKVDCLDKNTFDAISAKVNASPQIEVAKPVKRPRPLS